MRVMAGYPKGFFSLLTGIFILLICSGLLLLPSMLEMRLDWDLAIHLNGAWRLASAASHCFAGFVSMMLFGALAAVHMRIGWHRRENLLSGATLVLVFTVLLLTAVGIYYFGDETASLCSSVLHSVAGLVLVLALCWHGVAGFVNHSRRISRRQHRA